MEISKDTPLPFSPPETHTTFGSSLIQWPKSFSSDARCFGFSRDRETYRYIIPSPPPSPKELTLSTLISSSSHFAAPFNHPTSPLPTPFQPLRSVDSFFSDHKTRMAHLLPPPPPPLSSATLDTPTDINTTTNHTRPSGTLTFVARVFDLYRRNPRAMLRNERRWLAASSLSTTSSILDREKRRSTRATTHLLNGTERRVTSDTVRVRSLGGGHRNRSVNGAGAGRVKSSMVSMNLPYSKPKQSSREHYMHTHSFDVANTPYELLPDFCPPTSTLDKINHPRPLRAEWKGIPLDLSNDPHVDQLHPAEVYLASQLRLPAMVYLDNKRRIFAEYHARKEAGLGFRRTDAQRCARIDVNKASRLWQAFERVGWLD